MWEVSVWRGMLTLIDQPEVPNWPVCWALVRPRTALPRLAPPVLRGSRKTVTEVIPVPLLAVLSKAVPEMIRLPEEMLLPGVGSATPSWMLELAGVAQAVLVCVTVWPVVWAAAGRLATPRAPTVSKSPAQTRDRARGVRRAGPSVCPARGFRRGVQ